jgi:molecular chaperone DnaK
LSNFVGIDLGTSYSVVATLDHTGRPVIVQNSQSGNLTPSVVEFLGPDAVKDASVGETARRHLNQDPNIFGRFKRDMGTDISFSAYGNSFSPTDLSGIVLKKISQDATERIGQIDEAVITIPANFSHEAREATMQAAQMAGLNCKNIINEPTAAAIYYAYKEGQDLRGVYAVYDLGGGTFDVSIIRVDGRDVEVLATNGIGKLGGDDFDKALQSLIQREFKNQTGVNLTEDDYGLTDVEEEKKSLSHREKVLIRASAAGKRANIEVTRSMFEESISTLVAQTEMMCESTFIEAGVNKSEITNVFLAGGSTRIPLVAASVERIFGSAPVSTANVDEVVALGAALYSAYKGDQTLLSPVQKQVVKDLNVSEITSKCFGVISISADMNRSEYRLQNTILINKGTAIPTAVSEPFFTTHDGQTAVQCRVTESNSPERDPRFVKVIWEGNLELPEGRPEGQEIMVKFAYDENQVMHCSFTDSATSSLTEVDLRPTATGNKQINDIERFTVE